MPDAVTRAQIDQALERWDTLLPEEEPKDGAPGFLIGDGEQRAAAVQGLRAFTDLMESRPDIPLPRMIFATIILGGTTAERRAQLEHASDLLGQPVTPRYRSSDTFGVAQDFGPVKYSLSAYPAEENDQTPLFSAGQEVRLICGAAHVMKTVGLSQVGTVVSSERDPSPYGGSFLYTVHFPGRLGTQRGWAERDLTPAPWFRPIATSTRMVTSLQAAEEQLIKLSTEVKLTELSGLQPGDDLLSDQSLLGDALSRTCGLTGTELLRQVEPQVEERIRGYVTEHGVELSASLAAPELSASDGQHVIASVEEAPAQRSKRSKSKNPPASPRRRKAR